MIQEILAIEVVSAILNCVQNLPEQPEISTMLFVNENLDDVFVGDFF